ncbi:cupin domain-containing protein [Pseudostreptobacillus hongkongensis]|uniref:cupin domain-containing protein n=1 Tax=Pseudostreptobacillus hongkongensis TaxID=1162717 RepID=UPI0028D22349|nr:cupin domain-containing protein [Pseudostreptobacillus hongkongensis]
MKNEYGENVDILFNNDIKVERIESFSNTTGYMSDEKDEFVYLLEGEAILEIYGKESKLYKDSYIFIPKNTVHRVTYTSYDCRWLCIFLKGEI